MDNNKIGIMTSTPSFINNYGAVLQGYALSRQIDMLGYESFFIRYRGDYEYVKGTVSAIKRFKGIFLNSQTSLRYKVRTVTTKSKRERNNRVFYDFQEKYLRFYNSNYIDFEQLINSPPPFGTFICGSDQVWNPLVHGNCNDRGYFLDFAPQGSKRIAYAPSIGVNDIPETCKTDLKELLEKFDSLSVREKSGAQIIKEVTGLGVHVVLDPTLLLPPERWQEITILPDRVPNQYILCYKFGSIKHTEQTIRLISRKLNLPVISIPASPDTRFKPRYDIGPREFVGLIKNAALVCTDSFHASVFSIIHHTPFLSFYRDNPQDSVTMNSRIENLLETIGLKNRLIMPEQMVNYEELFNVDFCFSEKKLKLLREQSLLYLENALKG